MYIFFSIICLVGVVALGIIDNKYAAKIKAEGQENAAFPVPNFIKKGLVILSILFFASGMFNQVFFYAEPGFIYHVRTITGQERVIDTVGYSLYLFGRKNAWKKAMTVLADKTTADGVSAESEDSRASASLPPQNIMFLDQVDADASAMARFRLPTDQETFLKMAHEYRTPENLLRVALIPAFLETLQANASLMSAEDYYSGGRTEFINEFENQMQKGIYLVKRIEVPKDAAKAQTGEADASHPGAQDKFGDQTKTIFIVEKQLDENGLPLRKQQRFISHGISVHEARVTDMKPNKKFVERMQLKQKAFADRTIAREQKIQEEEQKLLAVARGDREVAERQAKMKVEQIERTTKAETDKKEALIKANLLKEEARIQKEAAQTILEKEKIDAEAVKVKADAEAYQKKKIITADNTLAQKLDAEIQIQKIWAEAFAKRQVPQYVFGSGTSGTPVGSDQEVKNFMQLLTVDAAKSLNYNRSLGSRGKK